jgi:hypothetical protein
MRSFSKIIRSALVLAIIAGWSLCGLAQQNSASGGSTSQMPAARDGQHDFDFMFGSWKSHIRRLQHPLTGSKSWIQMTGTKVVKKVWGGRALLEEVEANGPNGRWQGLTLFLYNPQAHQWSMYFSNSDDGTIGVPTVGEFRNGRGEFYDQETLNGKAILVRVIWSITSPTTHRFEQSFSDDGGKTWEPNFVADLTKDDSVQPTNAEKDEDEKSAQHDFDWELGDWNLHIKRLQHPLSGSNTWIDLNGTVVTRKVWGGRANLAEIKAEGPNGPLEFLSLRLYNPKAKQWSLNFASSNAGTLSVPMVGGFKDGRGEFYDQETFNDKTILVRFVFTALSDGSGHSEQAFSEDGGKTWEVNWINTYTRSKDKT